MPPKAIGVLAIVFGALALPGTVVCAYVVDNATTCAKKPRHDARRDQGVDRCRRRRAVAEKWATSIGGAWAAFGVLLLLSGGRRKKGKGRKS